MVYNDIDTLPIGVWFRVNKEKKADLLTIKGKPPKWFTDECYNKIMDQYVQIFGVSETYKDLLEVKKKLALAEIDFSLTGNRVLLNFVEIHKAELNALEQIPKGSEDEYKLIAGVQKYTGLNIDPETFSTRLFFIHVKMAQEEYEQQQITDGKSK